MHMKRPLPIPILFVLAATAIVTFPRSARAQPAPAAESRPDNAGEDDDAAARDAALQNAIAEALAAQELRDRQAEYERLESESAELDAKIASLEAKIEADKARRKALPRRFGLGESFLMATLSIALAAIASRRSKRESRA
jgi:flagellar motility protein MotE (MotC chaperone)